MPRLFISHSSKDSVAAAAFKQWLGKSGWAKDDVFLDVDDIGAGERWKEALRKGKFRCEAIILLASPEALDSKECLAELRTAEDYGKEIIIVLLRDLTIADERLQSYLDRQIVDLSTQPQAHNEKVEFRGTHYEINFNNDALLKVKDYLFRRGITPDSFPWPPENIPDADPFPGFSAFTEDDAGIFFGRETDILLGLDELRLMRRNRTPRLFAIQAASGAGKSSFLRAGLWPRLRRDSDYVPLVVIRPAGGILTGPEGVGRKLAPVLSRPGSPINPGDINTKLLSSDAAKTVSEFAKLMTDAAAQANEGRRIANPDAPPPTLIIAVDQAEELLAPEDAAESERFLDLLSSFINAPPQGVEPLALFTVRSDNAARLVEAFAGHGLEQPKTLMLLPVPQTSFRDVISKPMEVIARQGRQIEISLGLIDRLAKDASGADALPLLAFTLSYLYQNFGAGGTITLNQYNAIGGISGSIDKAVKQALSRPGDAPTIPAAPQDQLTCLRATFVPWLTTIDSQNAQPRRRVAKLDEFVGATRAMVDRLVKARLLIVDRRDGADVVEVAHESLLRQWPALTEWLHAVAEDLGVIASVERAAGEWDRNGRLPAWFDHRGDRLSAAERIAARKNFSGRFDATANAYLKGCREREKRQRRTVQRIAWGVAAILAIFCALLFTEWRKTVEAQKETEAALLVAQSELDRENNNDSAAVIEAEQAFRSFPTVKTRSALLQAIMELSPHEAAIRALGTDVAEGIVWSSSDHVELAIGSAGSEDDSVASRKLDAGHLDSIDSSRPAETGSSMAVPPITRSQDGNLSRIRALAPLGAARMMVVFDQGTIGVYQLGGNDMQLQRLPQDISINATQSSVAISQTGGLAAVVTVDETVYVYRCDWSAPAPSPPRCQADPLNNVRGRAVALSPDGSRMAVGDRSGNIAVYDFHDKVMGAPHNFDAPISALGWTSQGDLLAVGTTAGDIAVLDMSDDANVIQRQNFGRDSISALAWSPKDSIVAFVCNSASACLWQVKAKSDSRVGQKPVVRFEGHRDLITRLGFSLDGIQLASGATDHTVRFWNLEQNTDAAFAIYADTDTRIDQLAVSPDQQWLAGGSDDGAVQIWSAHTGVSHRLLNLQGTEIEDLAWNHMGEVAILDRNGGVNVVSTDLNKPASLMTITNSTGQHIAWANTDRAIAIPLSDSGFILLNTQAPDAKPIRLGAADKQAWAVAAIGTSSLLLVSYVGGDIAVWDLNARQETGSVMHNQQAGPGTQIGSGSLSLSPDGRLLAASGGDRVITVYNLATRSVWQPLKTESAAGVQTVAFSPGGQWLAAFGNDNRLYVWNIGKDRAELFLDAGIVPLHAIVGDGLHRGEHAGWLGWIANDRIVVATGIAALNSITIDPAQWLNRIDGLTTASRGP